VAETLLVSLAAMDADALEREAALDRAYAAGDQEGIDRILDDWYASIAEPFFREDPPDGSERETDPRAPGDDAQARGPAASQQRGEPRRVPENDDGSGDGPAVA
jgi:hypothetical protein